MYQIVSINSDIASVDPFRWPSIASAGPQRPSATIKHHHSVGTLLVHDAEAAIVAADDIFGPQLILLIAIAARVNHRPLHLFLPGRIVALLHVRSISNSIYRRR